MTESTRRQQKPTLTESLISPQVTVESDDTVHYKAFNADEDVVLVGFCNASRLLETISEVFAGNHQDLTQAYIAKQDTASFVEAQVGNISLVIRPRRIL